VQGVLQEVGDRAKISVEIGKLAAHPETGGAEDALLDQLGRRIDAGPGCGRIPCEAVDERHQSCRVT